MATWKPQKRNEKILDRAMELIKSVPYLVSLRWVFYGLLQEGYYSSKDDYRNKWNYLCATARREFYKEWRPDTLADDTREIIYRSVGYDTVPEWLESVQKAKCRLDKLEGQDYHVILCFEARAMVSQFAYYTENVDLVPMGGEPSIPHKWELAKFMDSTSLPVKVLYFGDRDDKGEEICETLERDLREWCDYDFEFTRCGLTLAQAQHYHLPENFEKPGCYQWESLNDAQAKEIIENATKPFLRLGEFLKVLEQEKDAQDWLQQATANLVKDYSGQDDSYQ